MFGVGPKAKERREEKGAERVRTEGQQPAPKEEAAKVAGGAGAGSYDGTGAKASSGAEAAAKASEEDAKLRKRAAWLKEAQDTLDKPAADELQQRP